jgi:formylglycine-generating enzyme required for sulfatase activity
MYDVIDFPLNWPVECNWHEAMAYCKWRGSEYRVVSEAEWHRMRAKKDEQFNYNAAKTRTTKDDVAFADLNENLGNYNLK